MPSYVVTLDFGDGNWVELGTFEGEDGSEAIDAATQYVDSNINYEAHEED